MPSSETAKKVATCPHRGSKWRGGGDDAVKEGQAVPDEVKVGQAVPDEGAGEVLSA